MKKKQIPHWIYNSILSTCIILLQTDHKTFLILHCYIVTEGIFFAFSPLEVKYQILTPSNFNMQLPAWQI